MLLGHEPVRFEVYNDVDGELVNCFRVIRNRPAELLLELGHLPLNSREEFMEWLHFQNPGCDPEIHLKTQEEIVDHLLQKEWAEAMKEALHKRTDFPEVRRASNYLKRVRHSYSSSGRSFACQPFDIRSLFKDYDILDFKRIHPMVQKYTPGKQFGELLIGNYDLLERERDVPLQMSLNELLGEPINVNQILKERVTCKNRHK